jgi:tetratricopeptide (TPR) repeat protein
MRRITSIVLSIAAACLLLWVVVPAAADDDLHELIVELTRQLKREPRNASLYLKRGEAHRLHKDWDEALSDYNRAESLDPKLDAVNYGRGMLYFDRGKFEQAKQWLDRFVAAHPNDADALMTRARLMVKLSQRLAAVKDYTRALEQMPKPKPEYYIERAEVLLAEGANYKEEVIRGIDEGLSRLGSIVTLELFALEIETSLKRYDAALVRIERLEKQTPRKEVWLVRRGEILAAAGRTEEARQAFQAALAAIDSLPSYHRRTRATLLLEERARTALRP